MLFLQSKDIFDEVAEYDPDGDKFRVHRRSNSKEKLPLKNDGVYSKINELLFILYVLGNKIFVAINGNHFELTSKTFVDVSGSWKARKLKIIHEDKIVFNITYRLEEENLPIPGDPTPFVDDEDFDFGLFLKNISNSPDRKKVIIDPDRSDV